MFFQHGRNDLRHGLVLEHAAVHPVRERRQCRLHQQAIARKAAVAAELLCLRDDACHHALVAVRQQQADFHRLAEQFLQLDVHVRRQAFQFIAITGRERFRAREAMRQQQVWCDAAVVGKAQPDQAGVLGESLAE